MVQCMFLSSFVNLYWVFTAFQHCIKSSLHGSSHEVRYVDPIKHTKGQKLKESFVSGYEACRWI